MTTTPAPHADDIAAIRDWFARLNIQVNALDFTGARDWVSDDFVAFGTFADFLVGKDDAERNQWRNVWSTIKDFHIRLDEIHGFISPDRLFAVGLAFFDSTGFREDGTPFPRQGRATVSFVRDKVGDAWVANHSHMSLMRGTPSSSHGNREA
ncbi:MAG: nuclear transport factor 2 family protein [Chelatococcus sp.]|jgi:ketosteroid isomerase-like protein|uniref:YybH family protein n=1 Tax=unclassified Chelatococcus TaxID=2638111 RepID=UPI001BD00214|nr:MULTISPECIES: nuclear transport factor 2 family protein [unclassified Chelatococcus]CAH1658225.1 Ketosteroid isomerase [Hyphomicrobiales bacterium]MBS7742201.1 nuclear transport factor 2 family protein [Chelatococcus sp. HY11]MBX3539147.1 nuclear transport factor 2 family protein [Chelatococcus sp.]MBX3542681.1 nuclear transport factor 2 family protein [Chelatococcus sp.]MCO5075103.1 nuclear transport factor 2 family protein [Chelatococcus sp.]